MTFLVPVLNTCKRQLKEGRVYGLKVGAHRACMRGRRVVRWLAYEQETEKEQD